MVITFLKPLRKDTPAQANRVKSLLSKMYNWGIGENLVDHNPAHQILSEDEGGGKDRVYSEDEIRKIWLGLESLTLPERAYYQFAFVTGQRLGSNMRPSTDTLERNRLDEATIQDRLKKRSKADDRGEILFMEWDEVDLKNGWWVIPCVRTKNRLEHRVPLMPEAVAVLKAVRDDQRERVSVDN
jgi:integrase